MGKQWIPVMISILPLWEHRYNTLGFLSNIFFSPLVFLNISDKQPPFFHFSMCLWESWFHSLLPTLTLTILQVLTQLYSTMLCSGTVIQLIMMNPRHSIARIHTLYHCSILLLYLMRLYMHHITGEETHKMIEIIPYPYPF